MIIYIKEAEKDKIRKIYIPRCCLSLGTSVITRVLTLKGKSYVQDGEIKAEVKPLTKEQAKEIRKMLQYLNKNYKGLTIVDIETKDEVVKIVI